MVINSINQLDLTSVVISTLQKTKEQIEHDNWLKLEKPKELLKRLGYLRTKHKREYILKNGLKIKNRRLSIKRTYECKEVIAFDTETYRGKCKLICCSHKKYKLNPTFLNSLKFLSYKIDTSGVYRFFYNLDFDITSILKLWNSNIKVLQKRILRKIKWLKDGIEVKYRGFKLKWIKGRMFTIKNISRQKSVVFTDIFSFFKVGLNKSSEIYLNDVKINDIDGNLLNTSLDYWNRKEKDIIKYCIQDSILTKRLGVLLIKTIEKNKVLQLPKYLVSSASLSKQLFRHNGFIPKISHVPEKVLQISYDCYFGGRFEMFKRGFFNELFLYDIVSQYPTFIRELLSLRDGLWKKEKSIPKNQCLGFFYAKVNIPMDYKIPTIPIRHKGVNKFPNGIIEKWFTWYDLDLIREYIVEIKKGYVFYESALCKSNPKNNHRPFKEKIDSLFIEKKSLKPFKSKLELDYNLVKLCMNAVYGCFIETHKNVKKDGTFELNSGILFNSVYASQITAFGRWSVIKDIPRENYKNIIAIHTDSIISDIPLDKFLDIGVELGQWNLESKLNSKGIIVNTGMYQIGYLVKTRGIPKKFIKNWLRFCLKNYNVKKKTFSIKHMRKLSEGLVRDKSLVNVNTIVDDIRSVNCNSDTKRDWISDFKDFNEVLNLNIESLPYYSFDDYNDLQPNPLCVAYRFEN